jgi:hypothetical protein
LAADAFNICAVSQGMGVFMKAVSFQLAVNNYKLLPADD